MFCSHQDSRDKITTGAGVCYNTLVELSELIYKDIPQRPFTPMNDADPSELGKGGEYGVGKDVGTLPAL